MKILISRISIGTVGGAELSALDQAIVLKELGQEVALATNIKHLKQRAKELKIKTYWFPWINRGFSKSRLLIFPLLLPLTFLLAPLLVWRFKPDIINPHSREDQNAFTLTKWLHGKPVIWKDAGDLRLQLKSSTKNIFKRFLKYIQIAAIKRTNHIYLLNKEDQQNLVNKLGPAISNNTSVIHSSILYRYYDLHTPPKSRPKHKIIVGTLARKEEDKGLQYLIKAVRILKYDKQVEYWLVNDGTYEKELRHLAKDLQYIKFFPYTTEIAAYLNTFDILVHPAETEGWGRVIKEAMYFGLPIIGSRTGGIKMQITDRLNGLLFDVGDVQSLARLLKELIDDQDLRTYLSKNARHKAKTDGDFTVIVRHQILPLYNKFI